MQPLTQRQFFSHLPLEPKKTRFVKTYRPINWIRIDAVWTVKNRANKKHERATITELIIKYFKPTAGLCSIDEWRQSSKPQSEIQFRAQNHISPAAIIRSRLIAKCFSLVFSRSVVRSVTHTLCVCALMPTCARLVINGVAVCTITIKMAEKNPWKSTWLTAAWKMDFFIRYFYF